MKPNDGGPAFPRSSQGPSGDFDHADGMSIRDWFAGMALQGFCSMATQDGSWAWHQDDVSKKAYFIADAMLKERNKTI